MTSLLLGVISISKISWLGFQISGRDQSTPIRAQKCESSEDLTATARISGHHEICSVLDSLSSSITLSLGKLICLRYAILEIVEREYGNRIGTEGLDACRR